MEKQNRMNIIKKCKKMEDFREGISIISIKFHQLTGICE